MHNVYSLSTKRETCIVWRDLSSRFAGPLGSCFRVSKPATDVQKNQQCRRFVRQPNRRKSSIREHDTREIASSICTNKLFDHTIIILFLRQIFRYSTPIVQQTMKLFYFKYTPKSITAHEPPLNTPNEQIQHAYSYACTYFDR